MIVIDDEAETKYYYHFDGVGSVIALSDVNSVIVERYSYDVFGEPNTAGSLSNPYLFTGRRYDSETALYYYRARYYDYYIGRFMQTDPIGYTAGLNLYSYVGNNLVNWMDPMGLIGGYCPGFYDLTSPIRPLNPVEQMQVDSTICLLQATGDPQFIQIADRLESREYLIDESLATGEHEQIGGYVKKYSIPNTIFLNPEQITKDFLMTGVREGRHLNITLMAIMIEEDWHLVSAYPKGFLEILIGAFFYKDTDNVHKYIGKYLLQMWEKYMEIHKKKHMEQQMNKGKECKK